MNGNFSLKRLGAGAALTVALTGAGIATTATPAMAAKRHARKSLTKNQVIALIKHYSKPGPAGAAGQAGTQFTTAANSGLKLSNGALSVVPGQGLSAGNNGLSVNLGIGMGLNPNNNTIQVNTGAGLNESGANILQLDPGFGVWGTCPAAQVLTALSASATGSHTCHYPTFESVVGGGLNASTSNPDGTITVQDQNASGPGAETSVVSTTAPGAAGVTTTYYLSGEVQLDNTFNTTQTVYCSLMQGATVIQTGADTFGQGFGEVNIQAAFNAATGVSFSMQCEDQTAQTRTDAAGTIMALPLTQ